MEELMVGGQESLRSIARRFGLSKDAVIRHKAKHLSAVLVQAAERRELLREDNLLDQLQSLHDRAVGLLDRLENRGDLRGATTAIREVRGCLELMAKMMGQLIERHAHLHYQSEIPPEEMRELSRIMREQIEYYQELKAEVDPIIQARMERHLLEGEAALPPAAVADIPRR